MSDDLPPGGGPITCTTSDSRDSSQSRTTSASVFNSERSFTSVMCNSSNKKEPQRLGPGHKWTKQSSSTAAKSNANTSAIIHNDPTTLRKDSSDARVATFNIGCGDIKDDDDVMRGGVLTTTTTLTLADQSASSSREQALTRRHLTALIDDNDVAQTSTTPQLPVRV